MKPFHALALLSFLLISCDEPEVIPEPEFTIYELLEDNKDEHDLYLTKTYVDYGDLLKQSLNRATEKYTFFAPTDEAWQRMQQYYGVPDSILKVNAVFMLNLMGYHSVPDYVLGPEEMNDPLFSYWTKDINSSDFAVYEDGFVSTSTGVRAQIIESVNVKNGIVHIIDIPLMPGSMNAMKGTNAETVCINYELEFFYKAILNANQHKPAGAEVNFLEILVGSEEHTVFATSDIVFRQQGINSQGVNSVYSPEEWFAIMQSRFVMEKIKLEDLTDQAQFQTMGGKELKVYVDPAGELGIFLDWNGDYDASNPQVELLDGKLTTLNSTNQVNNSNGTIFFIDSI